jgi:hypothetical protein
VILGNFYFGEKILVVGEIFKSFSVSGAGWVKHQADQQRGRGRGGRQKHPRIQHGRARQKTLQKVLTTATAALTPPAAAAAATAGSTPERTGGDDGSAAEVRGGDSSGSEATHSCGGKCRPLPASGQTVRLVISSSC